MKKLLVIWQFFMLHIILPLYTIFITAPFISLLLAMKIHTYAATIVHRWGDTCFSWLRQPYEVQGLEHIDPNKRYLIIANHGSMMDIPLIARVSQCPVTWVLKESLMKIPFMNLMFHLGIGIPIPRANARKSQTKMLTKIEALRNLMNPNFIIYPEGTRSKTGDLNEFKRGFVSVMRSYEIDILPVTLSGVYSFYSSQNRIPNPDSKIKAIIHPVQTYESLKDLDDKTITKMMQDLIAGSYYA